MKCRWCVDFLSGWLMVFANAGAPGLCYKLGGSYCFMIPIVFWIIFFFVLNVPTHFCKRSREENDQRHQQPQQLLQEPRQHQQFLQQHRPRQPQQQHLEHQLQEEQCDEQLQNSKTMTTIRIESLPEYNEAMRGHISRQESPPPSYERAILHM